MKTIECTFRLTGVQITFKHNTEGDAIGGTVNLDSDLTAVQGRVRGKTKTEVALDPATAKKLDAIFKDIAFATMPKGESRALVRKRGG